MMMMMMMMMMTMMTMMMMLNLQHVIPNNTIAMTRDADI